MTYIYFDESGDLGFDFSKQGTSKHLVVVFMIVSDQRPIFSVVKKIFKTLPLARKLKNNGILHAHHEKSMTIKRMLSALSIENIKIATIRLDKRKLLILSNPNEIYTNIVIALLNKLYANGYINNTEDIKLIASRRNTSKYLNNQFSENVVNKVPKNSLLDVIIEKPSNDKCLQAVDFISWAFWQMYEKGDSTYYDIVSDKIICEYEMYS